MCASSGCVRSLVSVLYCWPLLLPGCSRSLCACVCVCVCVRASSVCANVTRKAGLLIVHWYLFCHVLAWARCTLSC
jgi:hypothetical protein